MYACPSFRHARPGARHLSVLPLLDLPDPIPISALEDEVILHIFASGLELEDLLHAQRVCQRWNGLVRHRASAAWQQLFVSSFGARDAEAAAGASSSRAPELSWRQAFRDR